MKFIKKLKLKTWFPIGKHRSPTSRFAPRRALLCCWGWKSYFSKLRFFKKRLTLTSILETRFPVGNRVSKKLRASKKPIFVGLILILVALSAYFLFFHSSQALAEWWDTNWHYRKAITISNSGSAQTDFQVLVTADTSDTTKFQSDCDDLRFTSVTGQALDYWIESGCSTATTKIWVKIASIPANTSTIYMYYGNPNASAASSYTSQPTALNVGTGDDGAVTVSADKNINTDNMISGRTCADGGDGVIYTVTANTLSGQSQITLSLTPASGCLAVGDEILIINLQGTSSDYSNVGKHETARITGISTATLTLNHNLDNSYDGTSQKIIVQRVPNYTNVTVDSTFTLGASTWDGAKGGVLFFRATGTVSLSGDISTSYKGFRGHTRQPDNQHGWQGEGIGGIGTQSYNANYNGGGGGQYPYAAGGGGGYGTAGGDGMQESGSKGYGGSIIGNAQLTTIFFGGAGGRGGDNDSSPAQIPSGDSGGIVFISADTITVTGNIYSKGRNGYAAYSQDGGDGGGAGGTIYLKASTITITGNVNGEGGTGTQQPSGNPGPLNGGDGGDGRIAVDYVSSLSGSTTPSAATSQLPDISATLQSEEKSPGPVAYWSFDEGYGTTIQDRTTNNNDGTIAGATWQTEDMCISGKCLWYSGSNYVNVPDPTNGSLDFGSSQNFTVSVWAKIQNPTAFHSFLGKCGQNNTCPGYEFFMNGSTIYFRMTWTGGPLYGTSVSTTYDIRDNKWHHMTAVVDRTNSKVYLYGDGKLLNGSGGSISGVGNVDNSSPLTIGTAGAGGWKGFLDEVKIYPYARTAAQIKADYNARGSATSKGTVASFGNPQSSIINFSDGLVGYWKMDEVSGNAADSSGNANTGTWYGTGSHYPAGKFGNGGGFNGTDDYVSVQNTPSINFDRTQPFTISMWIKANSTPAGNKNILTKLNEAVGAEGYRLMFTTSRTLYFLFADNHTVTDIDLITPSALTLGNWYHFVVTYNGNGNTNGMALYLNGHLDISGGGGNLTTTTQNTLPLTIGASSNNGRFFDGSIDEVRIYNRALSAREVRQLYEYAPGPVGHWKMDESSWSGVSGEVKDSSGFGNNGTRAGDATTYSPGKYGKAGTFDGASDRVNCGTNSSLNITKAITIEAWVNPNSYDIHYPIFIRKGDNYRIGLQEPTDGKIYFRLILNGVIKSMESSSVVPIGQWTHVVGTYDGSYMRVYLNGVLNGTPSAQSGSIDVTALPLILGAYDTGGAYCFDGKIDDVRIYNYARTQKQILEDMSAGRPAQKSPVSYWKFDEGYGMTTYDSTGAGIEATGGIITEVDGYRIHTFTSSGIFTVNKRSGNIEVLVVAGGGGGGNNTLTSTSTAGGGGGAGGLVYDSTRAVTAQAYTVTVGAGGSYGGSCANPCDNTGQNGGNSVFDSITAIGGGGGAGSYTTVPAKNGGSGGGGSYSPTTPGSGTQGDSGGGTGYGNNGGSGITATPSYGGGGGGGAGSAGSNGTGTNGGNGGAGRAYLISGSSVTYAGAGGGGSGAGSSSGNRGLGGAGGGDGGYMNVHGTDGTSNTGGGGGGTSCGSGCSTTPTHGGNGGSGIVIVRYPKPTGNNATITGATWTNAGKFGKALSFNGTSDYITGSLSGISSTKRWTVGMWFKTDNTYSYLFDMRTSDQNGPFIYIPTDGYYDAYVIIGLTTYKRYRYSSTSILDNEWHYIIFQRDGDNSAKLYLDGILQTPASIPDDIDMTSLSETWSSFTFGCRHSLDGVHLTGNIDEVKIYNYALTQDEIKAEYNQGKVATMGTTKNASSTWDDGGFGGAAPIAEWKFEEHSGTYAYDTSGNGNTGTLTNMETSGDDSDWTVGKIGRALDFDGSNEYVDCGIGSSLDLGTGSATIEAWFKTSALRGAMVTKRAGSGFQVYVLSNKFYADGAGTAGVSSVNNVNDGAWHHGAAVYDRSGSLLRLYVDGKADNTVALGATTLTDTANLNIGRKLLGSAGDYFPGKIDQVRIYNYARTPAQIAWDYNQGKPIAHYKFDKGQGPTLYDSSGNGNNGTITPGALGQLSVGSVKITGNTMWYNGRQGKQNYSLSFDGEDDYVSVADDNSLDFGTGDFSVGAWFKTSTHGNIIISGVRSATEGMFYVVARSDTNLLGVGYHDNVGAHHFKTRKSSQTYNDGQWHHVVMAADRDYNSGIPRLFIDGAEDTGGTTETSGDATIMTVNNDDPLHIGANSPTPSGYFNGQIDDVRIYNYALTADQIKTVYNFGSAHLGTGD